MSKVWERPAAHHLSGIHRRQAAAQRPGVAGWYLRCRQTRRRAEWTVHQRELAVDKGSKRERGSLQCVYVDSGTATGVRLLCCGNVAWTIWVPKCSCVEG